jgi:DNA polymerase III delta subunit
VSAGGFGHPLFSERRRMKVVYGAERFLVKKNLKAFKKEADLNGANFVKEEEWTQEIADRAIPGFMTTYVHVALLDAKPLKEQVVVDPEANILVTLQVLPTSDQMKVLSKNTGWELCPCNKLPQKDVEGYIAAYVYKAGMRISTSACEELIKRVGYFEDDAVCMENVFNELNKFIGLVQDIEVEDIKEYVEESMYYNAFSISNLLEKKNRPALYELAKRICAGKDLRGEVLKMCGLLQQGYRVAYKASLLPQGADPKKELGIKRAPRKMSPREAQRNMELCSQAASNVKGGMDPRMEFMMLLEKLLEY